MESVIQKLLKAINEKKHPDLINDYTEILAENIDKASKETLFYSLPLNVISSIVHKAVFYEETDPITLIKDIAYKTSKVHEKEAILLLCQL